MGIIIGAVVAAVAVVLVMLGVIQLQKRRRVSEKMIFDPMDGGDLDPKKGYASSNVSAQMFASLISVMKLFMLFAPIVDPTNAQEDACVHLHHWYRFENIFLIMFFCSRTVQASIAIKVMRPLLEAT